MLDQEKESVISIHTPTQGATVGPVVYFRNNTGFQSTLPRKERRIKCPKMSATGIFQSTLPRKERLYSPHDQETSKHISIHAPTQGATRIPHRGHIFYPYFNPRSHARSDGIQHWASMCRKISIHAPTQGATTMCTPFLA